MKNKIPTMSVTIENIHQHSSLGLGRIYFSILFCMRMAKIILTHIRDKTCKNDTRFSTSIPLSLKKIIKTKNAEINDSIILFSRHI